MKPPGTTGTVEVGTVRTTEVETSVFVFCVFISRVVLTYVSLLGRANSAFSSNLVSRHIFVILFLISSSSVTTVKSSKLLHSARPSDDAIQK